MDKETYEALKRIMDTRKLVELLNEEKELPENERYFSKDYWQVYGWIQEVAKEYEEETN